MSTTESPLEHLLEKLNLLKTDMKEEYLREHQIP